MTEPWVGCDLDGTLAVYDEWRGIEHIGAPIWPMVHRVQGWLRQGLEVRIFTARISERGIDKQTRVVQAIEKWCLLYIGKVLPVTNVKDYGMVELWDDRCVQMETNTGVCIGESRLQFHMQVHQDAAVAAEKVAEETSP
jgi:hypothetical protein